MQPWALNRWDKQTNRRNRLLQRSLNHTNQLNNRSLLSLSHPVGSRICPMGDPSTVSGLIPNLLLTSNRIQTTQKPANPATTVASRLRYLPPCVAGVPIMTQRHLR